MPNGIILALMTTPQTAIQDLINSGYSEARVAELLKEQEELEIAQSTIHRIRTGKQSVRYDVGIALIRFRDRLLNSENHESSGGSTADSAA